MFVQADSCYSNLQAGCRDEIFKVLCQDYNTPIGPTLDVDCCRAVLAGVVDYDCLAAVMADEAANRCRSTIERAGERANNIYTYCGDGSIPRV